MTRFFSSLLLLLSLCGQVQASVELGVGENAPVTINEVYRSDGTWYLALDDVLKALGLSGHWEPIDHNYTIDTPAGSAVISPGSRFMRTGKSFVPIQHLPKFINGRLRVSELFITETLPSLIGRSIRYRNLNPGEDEPVENQSPLDRLFGFLIQQNNPSNAKALSGILIDPGHGGQDAGALGIGGTREKDVTLAMAKALEKELKMKLEIPVFLSRDSDYALSLEQRFKAASKPEVDALLILHAQASFSPETSGVVLFVRPMEETGQGILPAWEGRSMKLAQAVRESLTRAGIRVQGIQLAPLMPLGRGNLPTVLVEMGYLSNTEDRARLTDIDARQQFASALFAGLQAFGEKQKEMRNE